MFLTASSTPKGGKGLMEKLRGSSRVPPRDSQPDDPPSVCICCLCLLRLRPGVAHTEAHSFYLVDSFNPNSMNPGRDGDGFWKQPGPGLQIPRDTVVVTRTHVCAKAALHKRVLGSQGNGHRENIRKAKLAEENSRGVCGFSC